MNIESKIKHCLNQDERCHNKQYLLAAIYSIEHLIEQKKTPDIKSPEAQKIINWLLRRTPAEAIFRERRRIYQDNSLYQAKASLYDDVHVKNEAKGQLTFDQLSKKIRECKNTLEGGKNVDL
jgi:hypothetical protein